MAVFAPIPNNLVVENYNADKAAKAALKEQMLETFESDEGFDKLDNEIAELLKVRRSEVCQCLMVFLSNYLPTPLEDAPRMKLYQDSRFKGFDKDHPVFKEAVNAIEQRFVSISILDWFDYLRNDAVPVFNVNAIYMSVEESASIIKKWLIFQFGDEWSNVLLKIYKVFIF